MRKVILTCDRCHLEVEEIYPIHINIGLPMHSWSIPVAEWCRECLVSTGVARWESDKATPPDPFPTTTERLEEVIRCIVAETIEP